MRHSDYFHLCYYYPNCFGCSQAAVKTLVVASFVVFFAGGAGAGAGGAAVALVRFLTFAALDDVALAYLP
jgi:hypothetical protein